MKKFRLPKLALIGPALLLFSTAGPAPGAIELFDYGYNVDGVIFDIKGDPPAIPPDDLPPGVDDSGFDRATGLGSITATVRGLGNRYFGLFLDIEIDPLTNGFDNEFGDTFGSPALGQTWEIGPPETASGDPGDIIGNFVAGTLNNVNELPQGSEGDVAMALAWEFTLAAEEIATLVFEVSETLPSRSFYLSQTDPDSDVTLYFSSALDISVVPEPTAFVAWVLLGGLAAIVGGAISRRRVRSP